MAIRHSLLRAALILGIAQPVAAQSANPAPFIAWARANARPLSATATGTEADIRAFDGIIGNAKVIALGEPTYGTSEPLAMRNRLIRYLVEQKGFTAVALETGFTESQAAHNLVLGARGDVASTLSSTFSWGFGELAENVELITWIKQWNANPAHKRKVNFYGIDVSGAGNEAALAAYRPLVGVLAWLDKTDRSAAAALHKRLDSLLPHFKTEEFMTLTTFERQGLGSALARIDSLLERQRTTQTSEEYHWAAHNAKVALQLYRLLVAAPPPSPVPGMPPEVFRQMNVRDSSMAANVKWVTEREGSDGKLIVFAHNAHIMNAKVAGGIWSPLRTPPAAMGLFLRRMLQDNLVIIGSSANTSTGGLPAMEVAPTSLDAALAAVGKPRFLLDLRPGRSVAGVGSWLAQTRPMHANLTTQLLLAPATAFDAVVYFQSLTPGKSVIVK